jgi:hypothetical protein
VSDFAHFAETYRRAKANDYTPVVHLADNSGDALCGRTGCFTPPKGRPGECGEVDHDRCWTLSPLASSSVPSDRETAK